MKPSREGRLPAPREPTGNAEGLFETQNHTFIVKLWVEETVEEAGHATWRGHITHVPTGKRRYLRSVGDILAFIVPYLERMGVRIEKTWRLIGWFKHWKPGRAPSERSD